MEDEKTALKVEGCYIKDCELKFGPDAQAFPNFIPNTAELAAAFRLPEGSVVAPNFHFQVKAEPFVRAEAEARRWRLRDFWRAFRKSP